MKSLMNKKHDETKVLLQKLDKKSESDVKNLLQKKMTRLEVDGGLDQAKFTKMFTELGETISGGQVKDFFAEHADKDGLVSEEIVMAYYTDLLKKRGQIESPHLSRRNSMDDEMSGDGE